MGHFKCVSRVKIVIIGDIDMPKTITAFTREDFRNWLEQNAAEQKVCIILYKRHTGKPAPTHRQLLEEAICFGWIDTTIKRIDESTYARNFCKRNRNSRWSENTLAYAKKLIADGKMSPEGMTYYKLGLQRKTHDHGIPKNPDMPEELETALEKNKIAKNNFEKFPPSAKKMIYRWILHAKLPETRKKRVALAVGNAQKNRRM